MLKRGVLVVFISFCALIAAGSVTATAGPVLKMATTTSTANTGLLDYLTPKLKQDTGIELQFVAVGTGKALQLGQNCDVDVLLVHAPAAEKKYVAAGHGVDRREVMYNDFIIIGPPKDPAKVKGLKVAEALKKIAAQKSAFASRGDNSGTHKMELSLWKAAGIKPPQKGSWYLETGQGMINTINLAAEKNAYTMADRGTYIKYSATHKGKPPLVVLVQGDKVLFNQYSVISVNPAKCKNVKADLAKKFADWITSSKVQKQVGDFLLLGQKLFIPNAK